jgi:exodeoxyribonuclease V beta subunit
VSTGDTPLEVPFELSGPLPSGVTVLEASAGTGKTFTIAALATRFIAEGASLDELLLVSFTRMATGELRERVRERLVAAESELGRVLAGASPTGSDELVTLLGSDAPAVVEKRRERLARAIAGFDAATIETTHGFCQNVLDGLGTLGDLEPDITFVEDAADLLEEVVDDLYVRRFHWEHRRAPFTRREAARIAAIAVANPKAEVHPRAAGERSVPAMRRRLAIAAREELGRRKRSLALMTYDDQLTRLCDVLSGPNGDAAAARLRARYRVVLIDEFQDTDPIQWEIVERAFGNGDTTLVLIADPKQAIYAFRGADVYAYLLAVHAAGTRRTLSVNRRSDGPLLQAFDALFGHARLGHPEIVYRQVQAAAAHRQPRLHDAPVPAALRIRVVERGHPQIEQTRYGYATAPSARAYVACDLAAEIVGLLGSGARLERRDEGGTTLGLDPVGPGDLAVLVPSHRTAALVRGELESAGVPAVIGGAGSVFSTGAAADWLALLEALERPASPPRARAAALTPLLGWTARDVACAGEDALEALHQRLHGWARVLRSRGMAALAETIMLAERVPGRLLARDDGERHLTDLQHVATLLHREASAEALGVAALSSWLRERIAVADRESSNEDLTRRLDSDADAVQVLTVHRSKGLEFPIVFCPFLWEPGYLPDEAEPVYFHDAEREDRRAIDVGMEGAEYKAHRDQYRREERGEDLRLAYVALTRARHQAVIWWAGSAGSRHSPLGRLLFFQDEHGNVAPEGRYTPKDAEAFARFEAVADSAPGAVSVEWARMAAGAPRYARVPREPGELAAARFTRRLDLDWRRTSYSAITAAAHDAWVASEPEEPSVQDEPGGPLPVAPDGWGQATRSALSEVALPLAAMAVGPAVGTIVHRVLEAIDFTTPDLAGAVADALRGIRGRGATELGCSAEVAGAGLALALATPLGGLRLDDVAPRDRLDELGFELPLAGGDHPRGRVGLRAVGDLLREWLPGGDPLAAYAERLGAPELTGVLRGYLTGSIDLVARRPDGRFTLVDYKTNWLAPAGEPLSAWHYRPAALAEEMMRSHYVLQALLYLVALHRYLRWRVPGYAPETHLDKVHYLFLRGMIGPDTPAPEGEPCGVFTWQPPAGLVAALSDLLATGTSEIGPASGDRA